MHDFLYEAPRRDIEFLLWEQMRIQHALGLSDPRARDDVESAIEAARAFAEGPMTRAYRESDDEEAHLDAEGVVRTPASYPELMTGYRRIWKNWSGKEGGRGLPEIVEGLIVEMLVGANPSFVTYVGFNGPASKLLRAFGGPALQRDYLPGLADLSATACLCLTEQRAGSDLSLIGTRGERQADGAYRLQGEKWLISAGMHELSDNIYYFVLARAGAGAGMHGFSCFLVPRYRLDAEGRPTIDNHVRCREVVRKMGLRGCANARLDFGVAGVTEGYLLGAQEGQGLQQLMLMMMPARISTGIYALGLAAAAAETARRYAGQRVQGKRFDQSLSAKSPSLPIDRHADVRRMRLDMIATVMGCRALIARLGLCQALLRAESLSAERAQVEKDLLEVLLPIVKAYTSDQAWRVTGTAIQTMGGVGYLRDNPVEQNARDCKVLSIWEGTNHIQSLFLLRDKLGMGLRASRLDSLLGEVAATLAALAGDGGFPEEIQATREAVAQLIETTAAIGGAVRRGEMNRAPEFSCEYLAGLAEIAVAWQLLDAARVAQNALAAAAPVARADFDFYEEKIDAARYFVRRRLPRAVATLRAIDRELTPPPSETLRERAETVHA